MAGGAVLFGVGYSLAVAKGVLVGGVSGADCGCNSTGPRSTATAGIPAFIPVAGPFVVAAESAGSGSAGGVVVRVADGRAQIGGVATIADGVAAKRPVRVRDPRGSTLPFAPPPIVGNGRSGMGTVGTF